MVGKTLGHYEILELLGKGGMGEVYRALDTRLKRDVAVKVLPAEMAEDPERLARLEREAQLLASLNHPNIAAIYGLEEGEGARALVLELVEGPTLEDRLRGGRLPLNDSALIALQVAEALEAAHEQGIIHRDLKPANVKIAVGEGGEPKVKVLDFGLAKVAGVAASEASPGADAPADSPTLSLAATQAGIILGTAAYMSPEQAKGNAADRRTDIWAFGAVLYEMLAGRRLFEGDTVSEVLAAVILKEVDWDALPADTPPPVRGLLERCLTRDPRRRLRDIGEARVALDDYLTDPTTSRSGVATPASDSATGTGGGAGSAAETSVATGTAVADPRATIEPPPLAPTFRRWLGYVVSFVLAFAIFYFASPWIGIGGSNVVSVPGAVLFEDRLPEHQMFVTESSRPAVTRDGRLVAYAVDEGTERYIVLRYLDAVETIVIEGTEGGRAPFFSPEGDQLGFFNNEGLYKVSVGGGRPEQLIPTPFGGGRAQWLPDGQIISGWSQEQKGLRSVDSNTGDVQLLTDPDSTATGADSAPVHFDPYQLPDGTILFASGNTSEAEGELARYFPASGSFDLLGVRGTGPFLFVADGTLVYHNADNMFAASFDLSTGEVGAPSQILDGVDPISLTLSAAGTAAYFHYPVGSGGQFVRVGRDGVAVPLPIPPQLVRWLRVSPASDRIATGIHNDRYVLEMRVYDIASGRNWKLADDGFNQTEPVWSHDGERIAYSSMQTTSNSDYWQPADGSGRPDSISDLPFNQWPASFSPAGRYFLFYGGPDDADLWLVAMEDPDATAVPLFEDPGMQRAGQFSPNGEYIAYASNESGRFEVWVRDFQDFDDGTPAGVGRLKQPVSVDGGFDPVWSPDGAEIFYRIGWKMMAVPITYEPFTVGDPVELFDENYRLDPWGDQGYDVFRDGPFKGDFAMIYVDPATAPRLRVFTGLMNAIEARSR